MSRVVLYTMDMQEPITIIDLQKNAYFYLDKHRHVVLPVTLPVETVYYGIGNKAPSTIKYHTVRLYAEYLTTPDGKVAMFLRTPDEENALLLKSELLAGQARHVNEAKREAFARGFLTAIQALGL